MRLAAIALVLIAAVAFTPRHAGASSHPPGGAVHAMHESAPAVDQHGGSRVGVQLVVAGLAAVVVVGVGTGAYLLRRKLGLTAYSPEDSAAGHH